MEAIEQQNISSLNEARKNQADQESDDGGGAKTSSEKKLDVSEFLMWETGLTIFWLALAGWVPFWGGVVNALLIGVIYIWYASHGLNPPSFSPTKIAKIGGAKANIASGTTLQKLENSKGIAKKIPGGGTLFFILAVLSGGVGIIPTPMVLFFSIYLANK